MGHLKVSVIIPVYNAEKYLIQCIDSVFSQTFTDIEVILIDDGSTDDSLLICQNYSNNNKNIKVIHQENKGAAAARNRGINEAKGDYLLFLDADDFWLKSDGLDQLVDIMENNPKTDFCLCRMAYVQDWSKKITHTFKLYNLPVFSMDKISVFEYLVNNNLFSSSASSQIIRSSYLKQNRIFFENGLLCEDLDWVLLLWQFASKVLASNLVFYGYRQHLDSFSKKHLIKQTSDNIKIIRRWWTKEYDYEYKKNVLPFLADLLSSIYKNYFNTDKRYRKRLVIELKELSILLLHSKNKKSQKVKNTYKYLGVKLSLLIWGTYTLLKRVVF